MFYFVHSVITGLSIHDVINNPIDSSIVSFVHNFADFETHKAANLLAETLVLRDQVLSFSDGFSLSSDELNVIINYICIS